MSHRTRTSDTHPIRVDFVPQEALGLPGRLGMTLAPGVKDPVATGGGWERDLDTDLLRLKDEYGADALVSLMRDEEYERYGIPDFFERAAGLDLEVIRFPITDVSVPEKAEARGYATLVEEIVILLREGRTVVVHCRGGLGRTGTVAASALVALGRTADDAIEAVRHARPGTIETPEQEEYVRRFEREWHPGSAARPRPGAGQHDHEAEKPAGGAASEEREDPKKVREGRPTQVERYRGSLLGLAAGDALGTALEFRRPGTFRPIDDMVGGGPFDLEPGQWTDDTSMALCLAESLVVERAFDPADQLGRYVRWYREGHMSSTGECFDIGGATREALERFERTGEPYSGSTSPNRAGNGSIMRLAPVPLFYAKGPLGLAESDAPSEAVDRCGESSKTTHGAPNCVDACRYLGALVIGALNGASKEDLLSDRYCPVAGYWEQRPLSEEVAEVAGGSFKRKAPPEIRGRGYVVASLEAALWAFHTSNSFEEGALLAVNLGEDADTTGAVYGQLAGAYYGERSIPRPWLSKLARRRTIEDLAERLFDLGARVEWNRLLEFLPTFEQSGHRDLWRETGRFLETLYEAGVVFAFRWADFHEEAERMFADPEALAAADESDIRKLLYFHARKDRFAEGHLDEMIASGHIAAILNRARDLQALPRADPPSP